MCVGRRDRMYWEPSKAHESIGSWKLLVCCLLNWKQCLKKTDINLIWTISAFAISETLRMLENYNRHRQQRWIGQLKIKIQFKLNRLEISQFSLKTERSSLDKYFLFDIWLQFVEPKTLLWMFYNERSSKKLSLYKFHNFIFCELRLLIKYLS